MALPALSSYVPDRPPTWTEVLLGVLAPVQVGGLIVSSSPALSWPAAVAGFLACLIGLGPLANTSVGKRIDRWGTNIGPAGRGVVIVLFFGAVVVVAMQPDRIPVGLINGTAVGILLATPLYLVVHAALAGEVSGWAID